MIESLGKWMKCMVLSFDKQICYVESWSNGNCRQRQLYIFIHDRKMKSISKYHNDGLHMIPITKDIDKKESEMSFESCKSKNRSKDWKTFIWIYIFEKKLKERQICSHITGKNQSFVTHSVDFCAFAPIVCSCC